MKLKSLVTSAIAVAAFSVVGSASAAPSSNGLFLLHGTGDYPDVPTPTLNSTSGSAVTSYWTQSSINTMIKDPAGGNWNYSVGGYYGSSQNAQTSYKTVGAQIMAFYRSYGPLLNIVVVTHSNGSNPMRYIQAHPTAVMNDGTSGATLLGIVKKVIYVAGDNAGTPLADKVTTAGTLANLANDVTSALGIVNFNSAAVAQQVQANMATYNGNGTFAVGSTPGGIVSNYVYGSNVYANIFSGDAWCGGYATTVGLKATQIYGWGSSSAATDGFIGVNSSTAVGTAGMSGDGRLNHNQSRRSCHGSGSTIASLVHGAINGTFDATPPDYTIAPAAQACNATVSGWQTASPYAGNFYWYGCTSSMTSDANTDFDCQSAYGSDNGNPLPASEHPSSVSSYFVNGYYSGGAGCSDSWLGDGQCDLCLLAKYGYDSATGSSADDDCVNQGSGTTNSCADLAYYDQSGAIGYYSYTATH
jgi:hypothetical protein